MQSFRERKFHDIVELGVELIRLASKELCMMQKSVSKWSRLPIYLEATFALAIGSGGIGLTLGFMGLLKLGTATLIALTATAIGCIDAAAFLVFFGRGPRPR
jgi:hypothetical protein